MFELRMKIPCGRPREVAESLRPDLRRDEHSQVSIKSGKGFVELTVKSSKVGHMKAIANTYISLVQTLERVEKL